MTHINVVAIKNLKSAACIGRAEGNLLIAVNSLDRSRWYLGNVLWFRGYNSRAGWENNFGSLLSENDSGLFFHKSEISRDYTPVDDTSVLFRKGIGKNGKPTTLDAHILNKTDGERAKLLIEYLRATIEEGADFTRWRYRDCVANLPTQSFGERVIIQLVTNDIAITKVLSPFIKLRSYDKQSALFASDENFDDLTAQQISPAVMPSSFIDNDIDQFAV